MSSRQVGLLQCGESLMTVPVKIVFIDDSN